MQIQQTDDPFWPRASTWLTGAHAEITQAVLAVLGFTGLAMNLPDWVRPVVGAVATLEHTGKVANGPAQGRQPVNVAAAMEIAQQRVPQGRLSRVSLGSAKAPYEIRLRQPGEVREGDGSTRVSVDAFSGAVLRVRDPLNAAAGDTFLNWQFPLHTGEAFGMAGRVLVSFSGLTPLAFMITGLVLWLGRRAMHRKARDAAAIASVKEVKKVANWSQMSHT